MTKKELEAKVRRLVKAANWLTGAVGEFQPTKDDHRSDGTLPAFWFRRQFTKRAGLKWDTKKQRYV